MSAAHYAGTCPKCGHCHQAELKVALSDPSFVVPPTLGVSCRCELPPVGFLMVYVGHK
jgi:hypothetical protein